MCRGKLCDEHTVKSFSLQCEVPTLDSHASIQIILREDVTVDQLIDVIEGNRA